MMENKYDVIDNSYLDFVFKDSLRKKTNDFWELEKDSILDVLVKVAQDLKREYTFDSDSYDWLNDELKRLRVSLELNDRDLKVFNERTSYSELIGQVKARKAIYSPRVEYEITVKW